MMGHNLYTGCTLAVHQSVAAVCLSASALLTFSAVPVQSQSVETFALPAGCTAYVTVQSKDCTVDHHFTCEGDVEGTKRRVSLDEEGLTYVGEIDFETQWVQSFHPRSNFTETLAPNPADPASFTELLDTGIDTYDFRTTSDQVGTTRYVGADELTGRTVTIDGVTLEETAYQITAYNEAGDEVWAAKGNEFISRDWRRFLSGTGVVTVPGDSYEKDGSPVEFIFPGEAGFLSANPKHGCGVVMSSSPVQELKEFLNVDL